MSTQLAPSPLRALIVLTSPRIGRSEAGALAIAMELRARGVEIDLARQAAMPLVAAGLELVAYPQEIAGLLDRAATADMLVLAGPVHRSQVSGVMRNALELLRDQLEGKPVAAAIGAGSPRSQLAADGLRADLYINFQCDPVGAIVVYKELPQEELEQRAAALAEGLVNRAAQRLEV